jgi:hypothetical protein
MDGCILMSMDLFLVSDFFFVMVTRYLIFRHDKIGTVVEFDGSSLGDFRCCSNDFENPFIVTKYGTKRSTDHFCMSDLVAGLRINKVSGRKMDQPVISFGNWTAEFSDAMIVIKNTFAVCCHSQIQGLCNIDLERSLQIFLTEDSLMWVGLSTSINIPPISFRISNGVPKLISMSHDKVKTFLADNLQKVGSNETSKHVRIFEPIFPILFVKSPAVS